MNYVIKKCFSRKIGGPGGKDAEKKQFLGHPVVYLSLFPTTFVDNSLYVRVMRRILITHEFYAQNSSSIEKVRGALVFYHFHIFLYRTRPSCQFHLYRTTKQFLGHPVVYLSLFPTTFVDNSLYVRVMRRILITHEFYAQNSSSIEKVRGALVFYHFHIFLYRTHPSCQFHLYRTTKF